MVMVRSRSAAQPALSLRRNPVAGSFVMPGLPLLTVSKYELTTENRSVRHCPEGDLDYRYREARYALV
jgi:hypothetical protein